MCILGVKDDWMPSPIRPHRTEGFEPFAVMFGPIGPLDLQSMDRRATSFDAELELAGAAVIAPASSATRVPRESAGTRAFSWSRVPWRPQR
jgi:hypothetical protein